MAAQRALLARIALAVRPLGLIGLLAVPGVCVAVPALDEAAAERFANLALHCVHAEYPNKISHTLGSDADVRPPRELAPAFFGCYDWHSSVHGHWLLARLARQFPQAPFAADARAALARSLTPAHIASEVAYFQTPGRASYERPYGLAWLLLLAAELRAWDDPQARQWSQALAPLEVEAAQRLRSWLPKLRYPIRVGEHSQTAFAFGLVHDWARVTRDVEMQSLIEAKARRFMRATGTARWLTSPRAKISCRPASPRPISCGASCRRVSTAQWLRHFLPVVPAGSKKPWLAPAEVTDRSDPKLAHLDGLNLSRSWMLLGIASGLPQGDRRIGALNAAAEAHAAAALPAVTGEHYEGGHWLGTFAVYLTTRAGLRAP